MTVRSFVRVLALLALAGVLAAPAATGTSNAGTTPRQLAFRNDVRKLWEDHITWTRLVIVSFDANLPDLKQTEARLLRNQVDIGNAIKPYYGAAAGTKLTKLLQAHITGAAAVLAAARSGSGDQLGQAQKRWYTNAGEIARFLSGANPRFWPLTMTEQMMKQHLDLTTQEAVAHLKGNWQADIAAYDAVHREILEMADMLSTGIIGQFPNRFR